MKSKQHYCKLNKINKTNRNSILIKLLANETFMHKIVTILELCTHSVTEKLKQQYDRTKWYLQHQS
jgi:hypothetical protein